MRRSPSGVRGKTSAACQRHGAFGAFLPGDAMYSADYAVASCLSVRPSVRLSVTRRYSVETAQRVIKLFSPSISHTTVVFTGPKVWTSCYSAACMSQTRDQQRFTVSEVVADWCHDTVSRLA